MDEDLSLHPSEQKSLAGDPESVGTPLRKKPLECVLSVYTNSENVIGRSFPG